MTRRLTCLAALVAACHAPAAVERHATASLAGGEPGEHDEPEARDDHSAFELFSVRHVEDGGQACLDALACRAQASGPVVFGTTCPDLAVDTKLRTEELASIRRGPRTGRCGYELVDAELYEVQSHGRFAVWPVSWSVDRRVRRATSSREPVPAHVEGAIVAAMQRAIADGRLAVIRDNAAPRDEGTRVAFPAIARRYRLEPGHMLDVVDAVAVNETLGNGVVRALVVEGPDAQARVAYDLGAEMIVAEPEAIAIEPGLELLLITTATAASKCNFERLLRFDARSVAVAIATTFVSCN